MKPRLCDVALRANVSPATVSNALNGRAGVSQTLQRTILQIAQEMGYERSRDIRKSNQYVRMIVFKSHGMVIRKTPFFSELTEGIQQECRRVGLELIITHIDARKDADYLDRIRGFSDEENAGCILLGTEMSHDELHLFSDFHSPLIVLDNISRAERFHTVAIDNVQAGYLAASALYDAGHREIDHITSCVSFSNMEDRARGFREGLAQHGLPLQDDQIWRVRPSISEAYVDMKKLIQERDHMPDAFFAGNDLIAIGCMKALAEAGYRVPEDVSVMGMDDTSVCLACTPQLSTIRVYKRELGVAAILTLLSMAGQGITCPIKTEIGVSVVMRDSVRQRAQA